MNEEEKNAIENIKSLEYLFEIDDEKDFETTPSVQKEIAKDLKTLLNLIKKLQKENKLLLQRYSEPILKEAIKDKIAELNLKISECKCLSYGDSKYKKELKRRFLFLKKQKDILEESIKERK